MGRPIIDLAGQTFGRLTVIEQDGFVKAGSARWRCVCTCGNEIRTSAAHLRNGRTTSCGCYRRELMQARPPIPAEKRWRRHGMVESPTYNSWNSMRSRCTNPNAPNYQYYGGRGVTVCDRWSDFLCFLEDMGERPPGTSLDRIDPFGNYEPGNCRWATISEQNNNQRRHHSAA